jgi:uncharacterized protein YjaG (DUF416 family)
MRTALNTGLMPRFLATTRAIRPACALYIQSLGGRLTAKRPQPSGRPEVRMDPLHFDEPELVRVLAQLPSQARVAFAALCAERQLPNYQRFSSRSESGDPGVLREALVAIWEDLQGREVGAAELGSILNRCLDQLPSEEDDSEEAAYADAATAAVAYTIRARLTSEPQEAAWAARRAYDAVDHFVTGRLNPSILEHDLEGGMAAHPLVQAELQRQQADLRDLQAAGTNALLLETAANLQDRARRDGEQFPRGPSG